MIPRFVYITSEDLSNCNIHTFVDGNKDVYAAVTFLRIEKNNQIEFFLLAVESTIASLRGLTILEMELLATVIGMRLINSVIEAVHCR